ncbi:MAG: sodium-dependent bicarbonate transport family permease [Chloracidobacterium sp.]|uniref:Sodium-dependent bicarbonate transport family permease n=1 Tax=Chloracidobacterium validum TaxID=2821543 RepID=A0ABX8B7E8_9BACT|nr:sodium-dependent bicarbonate transport family permease [Chloracidobacterium validum]QUW02876.1 sodium-dependent bicarbonate transport family permease [Chloracidobacterium validum]
MNATQAMFLSLLSPMVLAFILGVIATRVKSDLKFPEELYTALTIYLLVAIGLKGGYKLSISNLDDFWRPGLAAIALGVVIPIVAYHILRQFGKFDIWNAAAIAAHYGSVSAVTFGEAIAFHDTLKEEALRMAIEAGTVAAGTAADAPAALGLYKAQGLNYEGFLPSLLTIMEVPAILVAIIIARLQGKDAALASDDNATMGDVLRELLAGKSTLLLVGFLVIGYASGKRGWDQVAPWFDAPFRGILTLFLLEAGLVTGRRLGDLKKVGMFLVGFGILMPIASALAGILTGKAAGLTMAGATVLGVLAASASYIAAPAACRVALPKASPTYYLTASLAITFPFNIIIGLPLYHFLAVKIYGL